MPRPDDMLFPYTAKAMDNPWIYEYAYGYFGFFAGKNPDAAPLFKKSMVDERCEEIYNYLMNGRKRPEGDYWLQRRFNGLRTYFDVLKYLEFIPVKERYKYIDGTLPTLSSVGRTLEERRASKTYLKSYLSTLKPMDGMSGNEYSRSASEQREYIPSDWMDYLPPAQFLVKSIPPTLRDLKKDLTVEYGETLGYMMEICPLLNPYLQTRFFDNPFNNKEAFEKLGIQPCYHSINIYFESRLNSEPVQFLPPWKVNLAKLRKFHRKFKAILSSTAYTSTSLHYQEDWQPVFLNDPGRYKVDDSIIKEVKELVEKHGIQYEDPRITDIELSERLER